MKKTNDVHLIVIEVIEQVLFMSPNSIHYPALIIKMMMMMMMVVMVVIITTINSSLHQ